MFNFSTNLKISPGCDQFSPPLPSQLGSSSQVVTIAAFLLICFYLDTFSSVNYSNRHWRSSLKNWRSSCPMLMCLNYPLPSHGGNPTLLLWLLRLQGLFRFWSHVWIAFSLAPGLYAVRLLLCTYPSGCPRLSSWDCYPLYLRHLTVKIQHLHSTVRLVLATH